MKKKFSKKQWWFTAIGLAVLAVATISVLSFINRPQNIGPNLEYLGEKNFGCSWAEGIITLGFCGDRESNHTYIYATDMNQQELESYFSKADEVTLLPGNDTEFSLGLQKGNSSALIFYHGDAQAFISEAELPMGTQKNIS